MKTAALKAVPLEKGDTVIYVFKASPFSTTIDPGTKLPVPTLNQLRGVFDRYVEGPGGQDLISIYSVTGDGKSLYTYVDPDELLFIGKLGEVALAQRS